MKFLKILINSKEMVDDFFAKYNDIKSMNYDDICNMYFSEGYWPSNCLEQSLSKLYNWECNSLIFAVEQNQRNTLFFTKWCEKYDLFFDSKSPLDQLLFQIIFYEPDVIYFHEIWFFPRDFFEKIRFILKNIIILGWDCAPGTFSRSARLIHIDMIYTCIILKEEDFKQSYLNATSVGHFFDNRFAKDTPHEKLWDVVFIGTLHRVTTQQRVDFFKLLVKKGIKIHIFGKTDDEFLQPFCSKPLYGKQYYDVLKSSKIIINKHVLEDKRYSGNIRMYEVTGVGSFLLTDFKEDLSKKFVLGKEIVAYDSLDDMYDKINYYLIHEDEREKIASCGQKRTKANYTYDKLAKHIHTTVENLYQCKADNRYKYLNNVVKQIPYSYECTIKAFNDIAYQISCLIQKYEKIAVYGNGNIQKFIKNFIPHIVVTADQNIQKNGLEKGLCHPAELSKYDFDIIVITPLGREKEIGHFLVHEVGIPHQKIVSFNLN